MAAREEAQKEIDNLMAKHGIGTYAVIMRDPDSDLDSTCYNGSFAWIYGQLLLLADSVRYRYNVEDRRNTDAL